MLSQYRKIKARFPDALILFRLGDEPSRRLGVPAVVAAGGLEVELVERMVSRVRAHTRLATLSRGKESPKQPRPSTHGVRRSPSRLRPATPNASEPRGQPSAASVALDRLGLFKLITPHEAKSSTFPASIVVS